MKNIYIKKYYLITVSLFFISFNVDAQIPQWTASAGVQDSLSWLPIGNEVSYAMADSALGEDVFIGIGGMTCTQELVRSWLTALYTAKLYTLGVRHLYSVSGPKDEGYLNREFGTLDLAHHLLLQIQSLPTRNRIFVAGHSSGAYVAHALFQDLYDGAGIDSSHLTDGRILYFLLDEPLGSYPAVKLTDASADRLGHIYGVYAVNPALNRYSYAKNQMIALGDKYGFQSSTVVINAATSGCTATMCLHMTMINQKPYQSTWYDARDYGAINPEHPVQTAYLDVVTELFDKPYIDFILYQNYPNPFSTNTKIKYSVPKSTNVTLKVFDIHGKTIHILVNEEKPAGSYEVTWHTGNLPGGVYFYQLNSGGIIETKKMILRR